MSSLKMYNFAPRARGLSVPKDANYSVGIERGEAVGGKAEIDEMRLLGNCDAAFGYRFVGMDSCRDGKPLYFYDENLWKS